MKHGRAHQIDSLSATRIFIAVACALVVLTAFAAVTWLTPGASAATIQVSQFGDTTPALSATPTPTFQPIAHGDIQCDGDVDAVDALGVLLFVVSFDPLEQTEPCPAVGDGFNGGIFGDVLCDGAVDTVDALAIARHVVGFSPIASGAGCPAIGDLVG